MLQMPPSIVITQIINLNPMSSGLSEKPDMILKIVFAGSSGAGKTSLLNRATDNTFTENYLATIGVDFKIRNYNLYGRRVRVQFWDTAGQERFRAISAAYYKGADAVVLCYNLNDPSSFDQLNHWAEELIKYKVEKVSTILVGCKKDLEINVPTDAVLEYLRDKAILHFETSAKTGEGVAEALKTVVEECAMRKIRKLQGEIKEVEETEVKGALLEVAHRPDQVRKKGCC